MPDPRLNDWLSSAAARARLAAADGGRLVGRVKAAATRAAKTATTVTIATDAGRRAAPGAMSNPRWWDACTRAACRLHWRRHLKASGIVLTWVATALVARYLLGAADVADLVGPTDHRAPIGVR